MSGIAWFCFGLFCGCIFGLILNALMTISKRWSDIEESEMDICKEDAEEENEDKDKQKRY